MQTMAFSSSGFSGSGDENVIGYHVWTTRTLTTQQAQLDLTLESVSVSSVLHTTVSLTPSLLDSSSTVKAGGSPLTFTIASLPETKTAFTVAIDDSSYTLKLAASDSTGPSDVTTSVLLNTDASWTFGLSATVVGRTVTLGQTTKAGVDGYVYLALAASESRPTITYILENGVATNVVSEGAQSVSFEFAPSSTAYGDYVIYVVQVSTYASDTVNIAVGSSIAVTFNSPCASSPCLNGGVCNVASETTYTCDCSSVDYSGAVCGDKINDCASSPCQNGGTCVDGNRSFTCTCPSSYTGFLCQVTSSTKCNAAPCLNGGVCYNATVTPYYSCVCNSNYTGDTCATAVTATGPTRPAASVRIIQTLALDLTPAQYPAFKADYAATIVAALKIAADRFSWVYFGPKTLQLKVSPYKPQISLQNSIS
jgi:hypothetical protein